MTRPCRQLEHRTLCGDTPTRLFLQGDRCVWHAPGATDTSCPHGRGWTDPCPTCERTWRTTDAHPAPVAQPVPVQPGPEAAPRPAGQRAEGARRPPPRRSLTIWPVPPVYERPTGPMRWDCEGGCGRPVSHDRAWCSVCDTRRRARGQRGGRT